MAAVPSLWTPQGILPASLAYGLRWGSSDGSSSIVTWTLSLCVLFLCVCLSSPYKDTSHWIWGPP